MSNKRILVMLAGGLVLLLVMATRNNRGTASGVSMSIGSTVLPASVKAARMSSVVAGQPGTMVRLSVSPGDKVEVGQEIAVLDNPSLSAALSKARLLTEAAKVRLENARKGGLNTRLHSEQFSAAERAASLACSRAGQFDLKRFEELQRSSNGKLDEVRRLQQNRMATAAEVDRYQIEEQQASQSLVNAREVQSRLQQECEAARAQVEIMRLQMDVTNKAAIEQAEAEWESAFRRQQDAEQDLANLRLVAQQSGTVLSISATVGEWVSGGAILAQIGDMSELAVEVPVSGRIAKLIKKGEVVAVRLPTDPPQEVMAPVHAVVLSTKDEEHPYVIQVQVKNPDPETAVAGLQAAVIFHHAPGNHQ